MPSSRSYGTAPTNVQVIAPATLPAGYTFDANYDGVTFTVTVPEGGVTEGQRFIVPFTIPIAKAVPAAGPASRLSEDIPIGVWRDDLCNCCAHGPCHPAFLNGWFCRSILIGQLLTRMKMTWLGQRFDTMERNNVNDSR
eukprot:scaffold2256_cov73-Cyclotella_meneghiniana.AAC.4